MDKRFQNRKGVSGLFVDIMGDNGSFPAEVSNISYSGLAFDGVYKEFNNQEGIFSLIVSSSGKTFHLRAIPIWIHENNRNKSVGVRISSMPRDWFKFVDNL